MVSNEILSMVFDPTVSFAELQEAVAKELVKKIQHTHTKKMVSRYDENSGSKRQVDSFEGNGYLNEMHRMVYTLAVVAMNGNLYIQASSFATCLKQVWETARDEGWDTQVDEEGNFYIRIENALQVFEEHEMWLTNLYRNARRHFAEEGVIINDIAELE